MFQIDDGLFLVVYDFQRVLLALGAFLKKDMSKILKTLDEMGQSATMEVVVVVKEEFEGVVSVP